MKRLKAITKLLGFAMICIMIVPPQCIILLFSKGPVSYILPKLFHKGVSFVFRIHVSVTGEIETRRQVLYASNHISYLDIPALGSILTASFVAKKEVENWPVFGFLSKMQRTVFLDRRATSVKQGQQQLDDRFNAGQSLILFPEGTSSDGTSVLPFKSSLLAAIMAQNIPIQPITLTLKSDANRHYYTWAFDDETPLPAHLWRFACSKGMHLEMHVHPVIESTHHEDRKALTNEIHQQVSLPLSTKTMYLETNPKEKVA